MVEALERCPGLWSLFDRISLIVNPFAGSLRRRSSVKKITRSLEEFLEDVPKDSGAEGGEITLHYTEYPGHAKEITKTILSGVKAKEETDSRRTLFISAGGDGTAQEISSVLAEEYRNRSTAAKKNSKGTSAVFRMPMGTGNDGLDAASVESALTKLKGEVEIIWEDGLEIFPSNHQHLYSFNIASIGLDGWVVHLSNKMKRFFPGSFYTIMADVAALLYEKIVGVHPWEVLRRKLESGGLLTGRDDPKKQEFADSVATNSGAGMRGTYLLMAFGVSGYRTYGGNKMILPNANNVCLVKSMGMLKKIAIKNSFYTGDHTELPETVLFQADEIEIRYAGRIPLQYDGEVLWLEEQDFPLTMRRYQELLPILVSKVHGPGNAVT
jgi:diacylglycerol kinase family enzyme